MLKWDNRLMLGIEAIDNEHAQLIERANALMESYQSGQPETEILNLIQFLREYVIMHFKHEEDYQLEHHYPDLEKHKQIHEDFKETINALYADIQNNGVTVINRVTLNRLTTEWILHHIGEDDKHWAEFTEQ